MDSSIYTVEQERDMALSKIEDLRNEIFAAYKAMDEMNAKFIKLSKALLMCEADLAEEQERNKKLLRELFHCESMLAIGPG